MNEGSFETVRLSKDSVQKIKEALSQKNYNSNPAWLLIGGKPWYEENRTEPLEVEESAQNDVETDSDLNEKFHESNFFFTQAPRPILHKETGVCLRDVKKNSIESLQPSNGRLDFLIFKNLSPEEVSEVVEALKNNLSETGISNLCKSLIDMNTEQSLQLLPTICSKLLLPKIIELETDSFLIRNGICECATKFPDEMQNLILTASLNSNPKSTHVIMALITELGTKKYSILSDFANHTRELKQWHFPILEMLSSIRADENTRTKLLKLFSNKAVTFSKDMQYAILVSEFAKTNAPFSDEQKLILEEIAALNQTYYKKLLKKYYES